MSCAVSACEAALIDAGEIDTFSESTAAAET